MIRTTLLIHSFNTLCVYVCVCVCERINQSIDNYWMTIIGWMLLVEL